MTHEQREWLLFGMIVLLWVWMGLAHVRDWLVLQMVRNVERRVRRLEAERCPWEARLDGDDR